jgi:hypothetical protein
LVRTRYFEVLNELKGGEKLISPQMISVCYEDRIWSIRESKWERPEHKDKEFACVFVCEFEKDDISLEAKLEFRKDEYQRNHEMNMGDANGTVLESRNCIGNSARKHDEDCSAHGILTKNGEVIFCCENGRHAHADELNRNICQQHIFGKACICPVGLEL